MLLILSEISLMDNVTMDNDLISYFQMPRTNKLEEGQLYTTGKIVVHCKLSLKNHV